MAAAAAAGTGGYPSGGAAPAAGVLGFAPLLPAPDVAFWQRLTSLKLDELRLDSRPLPVVARYESPAAVGAPPKCYLVGDSFSQTPSFPLGSVLVRGELKNFNTMEEFRDFLGGEARQARVSEAATALREAIVSGQALKDPALLRPMLVVAFADLKKYHFAYTVGFPVLAPPAALSWATCAPSAPAVEAGVDRDALCTVSRILQQDAALAAAGAFLLVRKSGDAPWEVRPLAHLLEEDVRTFTDDELMVAFVDSSSEDLPGWPLRNLILAVAHHRPGRCRFLAFRDPHLAARAAAAGDGAAALAPRSRLILVETATTAASAALDEGSMPVAGWSKIQNFDLTAFLDKRRIAADAVDLNVKLIKWRLLPELEPERMKALRFLLLGAGTLGCGVARALMGWGVRRMTFLDSGRVSLSNPVRQSLFTHADAAEGRSKARAAVEAVQAVMPDAEAECVEMEIPMPGHPHQSAEGLRQAVQKLQDLVAAHDVVCMLTDSRESRWLPSLLVAASQEVAASQGSTAPPLGITVALGFDSFLVSRQSYRSSPAACYFCNDMSAPADSLAFRTLDQQCTVTRPGVSGLASNVAAELVATLVQHADGFGAAHSGGISGGAGTVLASATVAASPLGCVPHQIRGYLADFRLAPAETEPFPKCICCSPAVLGRYSSEGMAFVERIIANSAELETISGLKDMKAAVREDDVVAFDDFDEEDD